MTSCPYYQFSSELHGKNTFAYLYALGFYLLWRHSACTQESDFCCKDTGTVIFLYIHALHFYIYSQKKLSNTFLACITILSCITSTGILIAFGNAQRDQGYLENIALLEPLSEDLGDLLKNDKKITIYLEEHIPLHPSYRKLKEKFNYIEISTIAKHVRLSSCFNIYLTPDMDTGNAAIIKSRLAYTIYKCANQQYMIKMNADYTPDKNTLIK